MIVDATRIFTLREIRSVIAHLKTKRRYVSNRQKLVVFRLATCCGLRTSEICDLTMDDVRTEGDRPHLRIRKGKGGKSRRVPLWWDQGTLDDLRAWRTEQLGRRARFFVCAQSRDAFGNQLDRRNIRRVFRSCCSILEREVTTHDGRHTFVSLALAGGRSLAEVRDAAGHASVHTTSIYLHTVGDDSTVGGLFG